MMAGNVDERSTTDMCSFLCLFGGVIGIAVYLQVLRNRYYWVIMETILGVVALLLLPFANTMIARYQSTGTNDLAVYLFRLMALARVCQAAIVFMTRNSRDSTVAIGISITNILARAALLMCACHGILHTTTINKDMLQMDAIMTCLLIVGDLFQISKVTTREGSLTIGDPVSFHLSVDGIIKFVVASWIFGFPDMFIYVVNPQVTPNEGQLALVKVLGSMLFGLAVLSFASLCFKNNHDGVTVLKAKLLIYVPAVLFGILISAADAQYRGIPHVALVIGSMSALALNAFYAVWQDEKEKEY